jgi:hypothetical protein
MTTFIVSVTNAIFVPNLSIIPRQTEVDWAKRRKSEYMVPGLINYTRQVIRDEPTDEYKDRDWVPVPIQRSAETLAPTDQQRRSEEPEDNIWPRRRKSEFVTY